jgi:ABC-type antimicrobial peptide transport system permease subunit
MVLHVRATGDGGRARGGAAAEITRRVIDELHDVEPNLAVSAESMTHATQFSLIPLRVASTVLGFSGLAGLALASLGVFGLVAYAVSLRTREIGIRMALGAGPNAVARLLGAQGMRPVVVGLGCGLVIALGAGQLVRGLLVGIGPSDPVTLAFVCLVLLGSAGIALLLPVWRAVRVDPAIVLRAE